MFPFQYPLYSQQPPPMQQQGSGFVTVRNIQEAQSYPVAPGNSVMFRDENAPYVYTKTMGYSQLERPTFERYRLVKEDIQEEPAQPTVIYAQMSDIDALRGELDSIKRELGLEDKNESVKPV